MRRNRVVTSGATLPPHTLYGINRVLEASPRATGLVVDVTGRTVATLFKKIGCDPTPAALFQLAGKLRLSVYPAEERYVQQYELEQIACSGRRKQLYYERWELLPVVASYSH